MTMKTTRQFSATLASFGLAATVVAIAPGVASAQRGLQEERFAPTARFIVEADSFTAVDESGFDSLGSDEVYAIWTSGNSGVSTSIVEDVDTGNTFHFPSTEKCIFPIQAPAAGALFSGERDDEWSCVEGGALAPVEFSVWLFEHDVSITCSEHLIAGGVSLENCADDLIGFFEFSLDESQLVQTFTSEGSSRKITKHLGGPCGYVPPGEVKGCSGFGTGPEYDFRFRITRMADAREEVLGSEGPTPAPRTTPGPAERPALAPLAPVESAPVPSDQRGPGRAIAAPATATS